MSEFKGYIDKIENGFISGWIAADEDSKIQLFCNEICLGELNQLFYRQDIIDAGISERNTGFSFDAVNFLESISGAHRFSIRIDEEVIVESEFNLTTGDNYILNSFMELDSAFSIKDTSITINHRLGTNLNSYIAPKTLIYSNGKYTRILFEDKNNTKSVLELDLKIDQDSINQNSEHPLEFSIVGKSSHICNVHLRCLDSDANCLYDEPILMDHNWELKTFVLNANLSEKIRLGLVSLQLRTKHYGRRHIDLAMVALTEDTSKLSTPIQDNLALNTIDNASLDINLLNNGELIHWSNGMNFLTLKRGQELADNWYVEMSKGNLGRFQVAVVADNVRQDPLANTLTSNFGLRARTENLDGYARFICPLNISMISELNYELLLDIEATSLDKKAVIPKLYFIPRNSYEDNIIFEIARKISISGRQVIALNLTSYQIKDLIIKSGGMPVLALAIDLPNQSDIVVYSASFKVCNAVAKKQDNTIINLQEGLHFEDSSISEQLHLLKGFETWTNGESIAIPPKEFINEGQSLALSNNRFEQIVQQLTPHKMSRPTRSFPFIDVIVPVYNACDDVLLCLSSLIEKTDLVHRVIIVNDGDEQRTTDMLQAFAASFNHVEILDNPENIGYTKSVNKGINHSNAEWVVVLNSDTIVSEGWLGRLMNCALTEDKVGMVGPLSNAASWQSIPKIHDEDGDWHLNPLPNNLSIDEFSQFVSSYSKRDYPEVGVINGFCQLINMELLDEIGLLDEIAFPVGYGEENDMCARAVKAGFKLLVADDTYVFHAKSKSFGHEQRKKLAKQGSAALKKKHPDVDWGEVTKHFREIPSLNELRNNISLALEKFENGELS